MSTYKVKVISLERRQDRRRKMVNMFQHIPFEFVNALDGQEYKLTAYDKKMIKGNEYEKKIGCVGTFLVSKNER